MRSLFLLTLLIFIGGISYAQSPVYTMQANGESSTKTADFRTAEISQYLFQYFLSSKVTYEFIGDDDVESPLASRIAATPIFTMDFPSFKFLGKDWKTPLVTSMNFRVDSVSSYKVSVNPYTILDSEGSDLMTILKLGASVEFAPLNQEQADELGYQSINNYKFLAGAEFVFWGTEGNRDIPVVVSLNPSVNLQERDGLEDAAVALEGDLIFPLAKGMGLSVEYTRQFFTNADWYPDNRFILGLIFTSAGKGN